MPCTAGMLWGSPPARCSFLSSHPVFLLVFLPHMLLSVQVIKAGYASCTGLSIFLVNALRAVGIPARMAGDRPWQSLTDSVHIWTTVLHIFLFPAQGSQLSSEVQCLPFQARQSGIRRQEATMIGWRCGTPAGGLSLALRNTCLRASIGPGLCQSLRSMLSPAAGSTLYILSAGRQQPTLCATR